jgi:glucose/arabinose dehydrogenase
MPPVASALAVSLSIALLGPSLSATESVAESAEGPHAEVLRGRTGQAGPKTALPPGFEDRVALAGLTFPTVLQFSRDGRVFIGEKSGIVKLFEGLGDPTPTVFADLSTNVHDYGDRGLLGMALDPGFPSSPYVYVLYTLDAPVGQDPPVYFDDCPDPFGDGCLVGARLSRLEATGNQWTGVEQVLIEDWCQQYISHSIGTLAFGRDGALYVGGGDGASFSFTDYGQGGSPANPCRDPGGPSPRPPGAQGGALRSQDLQTSNDPTTMDGSILRVDPATGEALPDNPLYGGDVADDDRIIASGLRNPFRFTMEPGSEEIWIGDVGWYLWEEIVKLADPNDSVVENYGWPCYEGFAPEPDYDASNLTMCENLYGDPGAVTDPFFVYDHYDEVVEGENCPTGFGVISAISFYRQGQYPAEYRGALFFADHSRTCMWVMFRGSNGDPDPSTLITFEEGASYVVDLKRGPRGDLFYIDFNDGQVHRIVYTG